MASDGIRRVTWCGWVLPAEKAPKSEQRLKFYLLDTYRIRGLFVQFGADAFRCVQRGLEGWEPA